jgi:hypothetical protein
MSAWMIAPLAPHRSFFREPRHCLPIRMPPHSPAGPGRRLRDLHQSSAGKIRHHLAGEELHRVSGVGKADHAKIYL